MPRCQGCRSPGGPRSADIVGGMNDSAANVLRLEAEALLAAADRLHEQTFTAAAKLVLTAPGPIITMGVGISGAVARKLAATLTSTGSRAVFLHPSDSMHGQLGLVSDGDVVVIVSNSGETEEILACLPYLQRRHVSIIGILGNAHSAVGRAATVVLDAFAAEEACHLGLAPTTTTTLALGVGDALAVRLMAHKGASAESFAMNHPAGRLGRRLTLSVADLMHPLTEIGSINPSTTLLDVLAHITEGGLGAALVVEDDSLVGLVTDGDVRRGIAGIGDRPVRDLTAAEMMTDDPEVVTGGTSAFEAMITMEDRPSQISVLPVVDRKRPVGLLRLHDLVRSGL